MELSLIRSAAEQAGIAPDTVRDYCRQGLLDPIRDSSGRRLFTPSDVRRIREIYLDNMARRPSGIGGRR
jgi:DNA-binding transcriptional MerR regulator